jgi:hypothetical protein
MVANWQAVRIRDELLADDAMKGHKLFKFDIQIAQPFIKILIDCFILVVDALLSDLPLTVRIGRRDFIAVVFC